MRSAVSAPSAPTSRSAPSPTMPAASRPASTASITDNFRMGVTAGYTTGTQWVSGFDGMGRSNTFQARPLWRLRPGQGLCRRPDRSTPTPGTRCGATSPIPGLPAAHRQRPAPAPTSATARSRPATASISATNANAFDHAVRAITGLHRQTERLHRDRRAIAEPHRGAAAHQLAAFASLALQLGGSMDLGWREKLSMQLPSRLEP